MQILNQIILGLLGMGAGFLVTWKSEWLYENFGESEFAEKYLRFFGGTRLFIKLLGIVAIVIGMLYTVGLLDDTVAGSVGWLFNFN